MNGKHFRIFRQFTILMTLICFSILIVPDEAEAFTQQVIQKGATGDDVVELQARMQYNGYYDGTIDGVFGWQTYWSVREFQEQFGLEVDGLVGEDMKDRLVRATEYDKEFVHRMLREGREFTHYGGVDKHIQKGPKGSRDGAGQTGQPERDGREQAPPDQPRAEEPAREPAPEPEPERPAEEEVPAPAEEEPVPQDDEPNIQKAMNVPDGFSDNDIRIMAQAVYGEARGEPYEGQVAVAAVILNRINSPIFPNTVSDVIFEPRAFTAVADGQIWMDPDEEARKAVLDAINGQDPSGDALYYFNPQTATSGWIWTRPQIKQIGKHIFCE